MANNQPGYGILSRLIAAMILTGIYCFSLVGATALMVVTSSTEASAQRGRGGGGRGRGGGGFGRGRGRGGGFGRGRGRGRGRGGGCAFDPAFGRVVCF